MRHRRVFLGGTPNFGFDSSQGTKQLQGVPFPIEPVPNKSSPKKQMDEPRFNKNRFLTTSSLLRWFQVLFVASVPSLPIPGSVMGEKTQKRLDIP